MQLNRVLTNDVRVLDCLAYNLGRISIANGFITDGLTVDRTFDPRALVQDKAGEYRQYACQVRLKLGDEMLLDGTRPGDRGTLGGVRRKRQMIEIICLQTLGKDQTAAGLTIDMVQSWLKKDIEWGVIYNDYNLLTAATALNITIPGWGKSPSYINPKLKRWRMGPIIKWPNCVMVGELVYDYDELIPNGATGTGL